MIEIHGWQTTGSHGTKKYLTKIKDGKEETIPADLSTLNDFLEGNPLPTFKKVSPFLWGKYFDPKNPKKIWEMEYDFTQKQTI